MPDAIFVAAGEAVVKSGGAVYQDDRVFRFYDDCVAERRLRQLLHRIAGDSSNRIAKASVECCSLLFIVNHRIVQLFSRGCSFLFSNERGFSSICRILKPDQRLAISGTNVAL